MPGRRPPRCGQMAVDQCQDAERRVYYEKQAGWACDMARLTTESES